MSIQQSVEPEVVSTCENGATQVEPTVDEFGSPTIQTTAETVSVDSAHGRATTTGYTGLFTGSASKTKKFGWIWVSVFAFVLLSQWI